MNVANPNRTTLAGEVAVPKEETLYGVFNDPAYLEPLFASGELPEVLRDKFMEPLWTSPIPGPAARFMKWTNEERAKDPKKLVTYGAAILMEQRITRTAWRVIEGEELEGIDDGRRANG